MTNDELIATLLDFAETATDLQSLARESAAALRDLFAPEGPSDMAVDAALDAYFGPIRYNEKPSMRTALRAAYAVDRPSAASTPAQPAPDLAGLVAKWRREAAAQPRFSFLAVIHRSCADELEAKLKGGA